MYLSISQASSAVGVSISTLRRWEREGKLKSAYRTLGGHRRYALSAFFAVLSFLWSRVLKEVYLNYFTDIILIFALERSDSPVHRELSMRKVLIPSSLTSGMT